MDLNRATIIGNVTRDPEVRSTPSGQSVASFGIATNMIWNDQQGQRQQRVEYHNITAWGKLADICKQFLGKGRKVYVEGRLQTREWEAQDGAKRNRTEIVAENVILLDRPPSGGQGSTGGYSAPSAPSSAPASTIDRGVGEEEIRIEDIPF